jgi:acyl-CoA dehydrogenase
MVSTFLNEDQSLFKKMISEIAAKEFAPIAAELDKTHKFPRANLKLLSELEVMGLTIDEKYGGAGMDYICYSLATEEISKACASTGTMYSAHLSLCAMPIEIFGNEEQKKHYLPKLCSGEYLGAFALSEPGNGSDAAAMRTKAVEDGDHYVLSGSKAWITNGAEADVYIVLAQSDFELKHKGVTAFIVEKGTPGMSFGKPEDKLGIRASATCQIHFDDCKVPKKNILGKPGDGFKIAMQTLDGGRIGMASQAIGIAQAAFEDSIKYAETREAFGESILNFQAIQFKLANMSTDIEAARLLAYQAACLHDAGKKFTRAAAQAKLFASEMCMKHTIEAIQIHGGYGYTTEYNVERYLRDAKITEIYEGTSEIQRIVIAKELQREYL